LFVRHSGVPWSPACRFVGKRLPVLESGQHIQSACNQPNHRLLFSLFSCANITHGAEFMNSDFLLAQPNRSCLLIGSHDGELIYAAVAIATFLLCTACGAATATGTMFAGARRRTPTQTVVPCSAPVHRSHSPTEALLSPRVYDTRC
jgi:hypothetical protein